MCVCVCVHIYVCICVYIDTYIWHTKGSFYEISMENIPKKNNI